MNFLQDILAVLAAVDKLSKHPGLAPGSASAIGVARGALHGLANNAAVVSSATALGSPVSS